MSEQDAGSPKLRTGLIGLLPLKREDRWRPAYQDVDEVGIAVIVSRIVMSPYINEKTTIQMVLANPQISKISFCVGNLPPGDIAINVTQAARIASGISTMISGSRKKRPEWPVMSFPSPAQQRYAPLQHMTPVI